MKVLDERSKARLLKVVYPNVAAYVPAAHVELRAQLQTLNTPAKLQADPTAADEWQLDDAICDAGGNLICKPHADMLAAAAAGNQL